MIKYEIIIYWSQADEAFTANVEIIIKEWIETAQELGRPIPAPRGRLAFA
jgi:predicted RNase H-like HicB family nuclease